MEELRNETLVTEDVTENVDVATEETQEVVPEKVYTEEDFNTKLKEVVGKRLARKEAKIRKEYEKQYGGLANVIRVGTGQENASVDELTSNLREFYESRGYEFPQEPTYSNKDIEILARVEAEELMKLGLEEAVEEAERLKEIGADNLSEREKALFVQLSNKINTAESNKALQKLGVGADVYESTEFIEFAKQFNSNTPISQIYAIYEKTKPKKEIQTMGSVKNNTSDKGTVKEYYSKDEAKKFTKEDFDKNPALYKAVCESMTKW